MLAALKYYILFFGENSIMHLVIDYILSVVSQYSSGDGLDDWSKYTIMTFSVGFQAVLVLDKPIVNVKKKSDNLLIAELTINIKNWNLLRHEYDCCSIEILDDNMTIMRSKDKSSIKEKKKRQK